MQSNLAECAKWESDESHNVRHNKNYQRTIELRNWVTGEKQNVITLDPTELFDDADYDEDDGINQSHLFSRTQTFRGLTTDVNFELQTDVRDALRHFNPIEQRILYRVLIQGQSVDEATKKMKHGRGRWQVWLNTVALPRLRAMLADYSEKGKVVLP